MSDLKANVKLPVPEFPQRLLLGLQDGFCNLKCPKCWVYGQSDDKTIAGLRGRLSLEQSQIILDEIMGADILIHPHIWSEPLMTKNLHQHFRAIKDRGLSVSMNTNALLLTREISQFLVDIKFDAVLISIDAVSPEVLMKTRSTDKLQQIHDAVFALLELRGDKQYPRVGISFTVEEANMHERDAFVAFWTQHADVVRVSELITPGGIHKVSHIPSERTPCKSLYQTLTVSHDGTARMCCLDSHGKTNLGNVLKDGVKKVWHGEAFQRVRHYHETRQYDKVPFCQNCQDWAHYTYHEEITDGLLIRRSPTTTYYNRITRLENWNGALKNSNVN